MWTYRFQLQLSVRATEVEINLASQVWHFNEISGQRIIQASEWRTHPRLRPGHSLSAMKKISPVRGK
jgi:hypothetical protein